MIIDVESARELLLDWDILDLLTSLLVANELAGNSFGDVFDVAEEAADGAAGALGLYDREDHDDLYHEYEEGDD